MRIVVFGPQRRVGALRDDRVVDLSAADPSLPATLEEFIQAGPRALDAARKAVEQAGTDGPSTQPLGSVQLHAPAVHRPRIACAGGNYAVHFAGAQSARTGQEVDPAEVYQQVRSAPPWGFWKVAGVRGPAEDVSYPGRARLFDFEGELAVVIGSATRDVPESKVKDHIWGITLLNDWSIRNDMGPGRVLNFNLPKNFDGSTTLGPCVVAGEDVDVQDVTVDVRVNDEVRQSYNSRDMIFSFAELIAYLSRDFTFQPGDVVAAGTGPGTAMDSTRPAPDGSTPPDLFLSVGDMVEVSSPQVGALRNRVVAKTS
jgi:2-keto-4-pentenoate hydratase/2-oxohepta-3-ene-1,7-dioic acid hydratase in catechol pathway